MTLTLSSGSYIENITGTSSGDTITGNTLANVIDGGAGADTIDGGAGNDTIIGGEGDDSTIGGSGDDTFKYSGGITLGTDTVDGGSDSYGDTLHFGGATGSTALSLDLGSTSTQSGQAGIVNLILTSATGLESVIGTANNDVITANSRNNMLDGGAGNDTYRFVGELASSTDSIYDPSGDNVLDFSGLTHVYYGGVTVDIGSTATQTVRTDLALTLDPATVIKKVIGTAANDSITGNSLDNTIMGGAGNDTLKGLGGADRLEGENGNDWLEGGSGIDTLNGGSGSDTQKGGSGEDTVEDTIETYIA